MATPETKEQPLFVLVTQARALADTLASMGMNHNAEVIRDLINRVVPVKIVPTRGKPMRAVADPIAIPVGKTWCVQCEKLVAQGCKSKFCGVLA